MHRKFFYIAFLSIVIIGAGTWYVVASSVRYSDTEAGFDELPLHAAEGDASPLSLPSIIEPIVQGRIQWGAYWRDMTSEEQRVYVDNLAPLTGAPRVGIQAGHWQLAQVPEELKGLQASSGAQGGGHTEQETVLEIARQVKTILEADGVIVDLLPATVPVDYRADAFVSIHADGSSSTDVSGFKIAPSRRDFSGKAQVLVDALYNAYGPVSNLRKDPNITRRMSGYYAFNWRRYDHALHPMTPAAIIETGFMTNAGDRALLVEQPEIAARGIANGIRSFLQDIKRL